MIKDYAKVFWPNVREDCKEINSMAVDSKEQDYNTKELMVSIFNLF
jgi:hypothetical protein